MSGSRERLIEEARKTRAQEREDVMKGALHPPRDPQHVMLVQIAEILELISLELSGINHQMAELPRN